MRLNEWPSRVNSLSPLSATRWAKSRSASRSVAWVRDCSGPRVRLTATSASSSALISASRAAGRTAWLSRFSAERAIRTGWVSTRSQLSVSNRDFRKTSPKTLLWSSSPVQSTRPRS